MLRYTARTLTKCLLNSPYIQVKIIFLFWPIGPSGVVEQPLVRSCSDLTNIFIDQRARLVGPQKPLLQSLKNGYDLSSYLPMLLRLEIIA